MPKFITYQRPHKVDRNAWIGRQGRPPTGRIPKMAKSLPPAPNEAPIQGIELVIPRTETR